MKWPERKLDELGTVSRGRSRHRPRNEPSLYGGLYPFIQTADVKHADLYITSHSQNYNDLGLAQSKLWPKDTLCITIAANIADTALLSYESCFPDSIIGFIADPNESDVRYVKYFFDLMQRRFKQISQGAAQDNLSQEKLLSIPIPTPPLTVQRKIADILTAYADLIDNNNRRIALLEEAIHRLYREWFVHLRFPGHEHIPVVAGVPEGWEKRQLQDVMTLQRGFDLPTSKREIGDIPIYASTGIAGFHNKAKIDGPGVVTGRSGSLGKVMYVYTDFWPLNTSLWVKEFKGIPTEFACLLLEELHLEKFNSGGAVPTLNRNHVHTHPIIKPPKFLLERFEEIIKPFFAQIKTLTDQNKVLAEARDALLPRLMNGSLPV